MNCKVCGKPTPAYYKPTGGVRYRLTCDDECKGKIVAKNFKPGKTKQYPRRAAQKAALAALREKNANPFAKRRAYRRDIVRQV